MKRTALSRCISFAALVCALACASAASAATETVLHTFAGSDGAMPNGALVADRAGNLYGVTVYGSRWGYGTVFELSPPAGSATSWTERVIYTFRGGLDGTGSPFALAIDSAGNVFGANQSGGFFGGGVAYELSPPRSGGVRWTLGVHDGERRPRNVPRRRLRNGVSTRSATRGQRPVDRNPVV